MESLIIRGKRFEIEVSQFSGNTGEGYKFYCSMWQMDGFDRRVHLYSIEYGLTEQEARKKMDNSINVALMQ